MNMIEARELCKSYGATRALAGCTLAVPEGRIVGLVGPNGAGKSTLLSIVVGLSSPTAGEISVLGGYRPGVAAALDGIAFVAQDAPLYRNLSAADLIHVAANLNRRFDRAYATDRLAALDIPLARKAGQLSGGQHAQLALTLALARHPRLLVLDEPMAMLDPVARHDFMAAVMQAVADDGVSVVLSSHVLAELERVVDYLVLVSHGSVRLDGDVEDLLAHHWLLSGPVEGLDRVAACTTVLQAATGSSQAHLYARWTSRGSALPPGWEGRTLTLEELTLAYLRAPGGAMLAEQADRTFPLREMAR